MKKFKINRNKPEISEESINKHKDFNKVLSSYKSLYNQKKATRPLYKDPKFMGFIIMMGIVLLTIIVTENEEVPKTDEIKSDTTENSNRIEPENSDSASILIIETEK